MTLGSITEKKKDIKEVILDYFWIKTVSVPLQK